MHNLVIQFPRDDEEFRSAIETQFGDTATLAESKSFDGIGCFQAIVTIALPLLPDAVDFFTSYLKESQKRIILSPNGEITFVNYSVDDFKKEITQLIKESPKY